MLIIDPERRGHSNRGVLHIRDEIEKRFNISLPLDAAGPAVGGEPRTAGDLLAIVARCVREQDAWSNRTSTTLLFRDVSKALSETCGAAIRRVRPSTLLAELMPRHDRREIWENLSHRLDASLPPLESPEWFRRAKKLWNHVSGIASLLFVASLLCWPFWRALLRYAPAWIQHRSAAHPFLSLLCLIAGGWTVCGL